VLDEPRPRQDNAVRGSRRRSRGLIFRPRGVFLRWAGRSRKPLRGRAFHVATHDPMMATVAGRYAAALFDLATEQQPLHETEQDMLSPQPMLNDSEDLRRLARSPVLSADEQGRAVAAVAEKASLGPLTVNFLKLVARNRRLFVVQDMIKNFRL